MSHISLNINNEIRNISYPKQSFIFLHLIKFGLEETVSVLEDSFQHYDQFLQTDFIFSRIEFISFNRLETQLFCEAL